jgi:sulfotransferase family protein
VASVNPFLFVVGCPRSGTTLLQRLLDAHPQLAVINETLWITREADGRVTPDLVSRLFENRRFQRLGMVREEVERLVQSDGSISYPGFVSAVFDLYGRAQGKALVGDKSPGYVREIPALHRLWPGAKFVHIIRDGRDVWLSLANWKKAERSMGDFATWAEDPVATAALWWERSVLLGREAAALLGPELYYEVRYENLVANPAQACQELCGFLGLPYDEAMLRFHEGHTRNEPGLTSKRAWLPPTLGLRDWQTEMPGDEVERFEGMAGALIDELGYPRSRSHPRPEVLEHAARVRELFTEDARARRRALPGGWRR